MSKKVLVVGGGGRCHAIVDSLSRSAKVSKIYCAPGNAGIGAQAECVPIQVSDIPALLEFAKSNAIDMTVVGPEASLAAGIVDAFREAGLAIFGPTKAAARIESSKEYAKDLMARHDIPTAAYRTFSDFDEALAYVKAGPIPVVIKYDGLAAGKGVVVALTLSEAEDALRDMLLDEAFGKGRVVIEEFLDGPEFSFMCLVNGDRLYPLDIARDHKRDPTPAVWVHIHLCRSAPLRSARQRLRQYCVRWPRQWSRRVYPLQAYSTEDSYSTKALRKS